MTVCPRKFKKKPEHSLMRRRHSHSRQKKRQFPASTLAQIGTLDIVAPVDLDQLCHDLHRKHSAALVPSLLGLLLEHAHEAFFDSGCARRRVRKIGRPRHLPIGPPSREIIAMQNELGELQLRELRV